MNSRPKKKLPYDNNNAGHSSFNQSFGKPFLNL